MGGDRPNNRKAHMHMNSIGSSFLLGSETSRECAHVLCCFLLVYRVVLPLPHKLKWNEFPPSILSLSLSCWYYDLNGDRWSIAFMFRCPVAGRGRRQCEAYLRIHAVMQEEAMSCMWDASSQSLQFHWPPTCKLQVGSIESKITH